MHIGTSVLFPMVVNPLTVLQLIAYAIDKKPLGTHKMYPNPNSQSTYTVTMTLKFSKQMLVVCHLLNGMQRIRKISCKECKEYVKYLAVLIDSHLSWKFHIDYVASKLSKIVGIIARLRHFVPFNTLLSIYQSLMFPY